MSSWLDEAKRLDVAVYAAVAATPTPTLDRVMRRLSHAADYSRLSLSAAAAPGLPGGPGGAPRAPARALVGGRAPRRGERRRQAAQPPPPSGSHRRERPARAP